MRHACQLPPLERSSTGSKEAVLPPGVDFGVPTIAEGDNDSEEEEDPMEKLRRSLIRQMLNAGYNHDCLRLVTHEDA